MECSLARYVRVEGFGLGLGLLQHKPEYYIKGLKKDRETRELYVQFVYAQATRTQTRVSVLSVSVKSLVCMPQNVDFACVIAILTTQFHKRLKFACGSTRIHACTFNVLYSSTY